MAGILATRISNVLRPKGAPTVIESGSSSVYPEDRLAKALAWLSLGLGAAELLAARRFTRSLGMQGSESVVRAFGMREIASGLLTLSVDRKAGLWTRAGGDGLDMAALMGGMRLDNPHRRNVRRALMAVAGIAALDIFAAWAVSQRQKRTAKPRDFSDRTGFPRGLPSGGRATPLAMQTSASREVRT